MSVRPGVCQDEESLRRGLVQDVRIASAEEATLVDQAIAGDREAFGELYERYVRRVYRYLLYMAKDVDVAEELTAETFLQALAAIHRYQRRGVPYVAWLLRIAHNLQLNLNGRRARRNVPLVHEDQEGVVGSPESSLEHKVSGERLMQAVQTLNADQRQVIILRFIEGLNCDDTARVVGKSVAAVRTAQCRALRTLRQRLEDVAGGV
jgi:RNA polymerase sigma-70 factor (ECF subfamily)